MISTKTVDDIQLELAYRLGESSIPTSTTEQARRLSWIAEAVMHTVGGERVYWFMQKRATDITVVAKQNYDYPTGFRKLVRLKVDNYEYDGMEIQEVYEKYELPLTPVPILSSMQERRYYDLDEQIWLIPIPSSVPSAVSISSITQTSGVATVTTATVHGYLRNDYVTVAGADQTGYNIKGIILSVPSTTTFTYAVASGTTSPATGTMTVTKDNIEFIYYESPTEPSASSSSIYIPDSFSSMATAYAEGRYWSTAHKRAKSADAFIEYDTWINKLNQEDWRKRHLTY